MTYSVYWIKHQEHADIKTQGYVGISKRPQRRFYEHSNRSRQKNHHLKNALNKYKNEILIEIIIDDIDIEFAKLIEQELRPYENIGWNIAQGGMCPANKRKPLSEKHKQNLSKALKGKAAWNKGLKTGKCSEETKNKIRMAALKRTNIHGMLNKKHSEESKLQISLTKKLNNKNKKANINDL